MGILKDRFLIFLILVGLAIRLILLSLPGFKYDVDAWFTWSERLAQLGYANFYTEQVWTHYTPGYLYILSFLRWTKDLLSIDTSLFQSILKIPSVIAEVLLGILIYKLLVTKSVIWARIAIIAILFNPTFIFNSAVWGQIDGLLSLILALVVYFLAINRLTLSSILWALAFLVKPQAISLLPVMGLYLYKSFSWRNFLKLTLPAVLITFLLSLPFFTTQPLGFINLLYKMIEDYQYNSLNAYNFWGIFGFWISDNKVFAAVTLKNWGSILYILYLLPLIYLYLKKKLSLYSLATLVTLSFYFLPTRVHERYLYPSLVFLILLACNYRSILLILLTSLLSLIHFLNLYYVYVYYNEIYLKLPKVVYNPIVYNLLVANGKFLSIISTFIFIVISIIIITSYGTSKKN